VTSYKALCQDARECDRWNRLHPGEEPREPYVRQVLAADAGPVVAALDYVSAVALAISPWVGPDYSVLGTDGFGRSEARKELRRFFEVDAENITLAALEQLARKGQFPQAKLPQAIKTLGLDPNKPNPATAG
jgi:pyruvate dehydrogenase E1 component